MPLAGMLRGLQPQARACLALRLQEETGRVQPFRDLDNGQWDKEPVVGYLQKLQDRAAARGSRRGARSRRKGGQ